MKFRKKPLVIEAEQYTGDRELNGLCHNANCFLCDVPHVHTIHNNQPVKVEVGDWIIPEPDGTHFYPCNPDVFSVTYEVVDE